MYQGDHSEYYGNKMKEKIQIFKFNPEDMLSLLKNTDCADNARLKQISGPALSIFLNDELVSCAGIQTSGVGEAWAFFSEKAKEHKRALLVETKKYLDFLIRENDLWHIWAECPDEIVKQNFLEHLNFRKIQAFVRG